MERKIINNKKEITIYTTSTKKQLPVVVINNYEEETKEIYEKCREIKCNDFLLVGISNIDWNREMTPWPAEKSFKQGEDYLGEASLYLKELEEEIIPKVKEVIEKEWKIEIVDMTITGYSLGALFAIYASLNSNTFQNVMSASASMWYPNFLEYIKENKEKINAKKLYLSLGNKESKTKNVLLSSVEENTKELYNILKEKTNCIYEVNEGNHFQEETLRIAKGIKWILEDNPR